MSRLSLLLLLPLLLLGSANATQVDDSNDVSPAPPSLMLKRDAAEVELSRIAQFTSEKNTASSTSASWVVGLGLCLVFIGYKLKNKAE